MRTARIARTLAFVASSVVCGDTIASVRAEPEIPVSLRVGETLTVQLPSERGYSLGSAGSALTLIRERQDGSTTTYVYRAVSAGTQTWVATPREPGPDGCVSCVTIHYFAEVVR